MKSTRSFRDELENENDEHKLAEIAKTWISEQDHSSVLNTIDSAVKVLFNNEKLKVLLLLIKEFSDTRAYIVQSTSRLAPENQDLAILFLLSCPTSVKDKALLSFPIEQKSKKIKRKDNFDPELMAEKVRVLRDSYTEELSKAWSFVLSLPKSSRQNKLLVKTLHEKAFHKVSDPLIFSDFYLKEFEKGKNPYKALEGLFILCSEHGLEAKMYYKRLYTLLKEFLNEGKEFKDSFFDILGKSLASKMLAPKLISSFLKLLFSYSLEGHVNMINWSIEFALKSLKMHPTLEAMISSNSTDTFDFQEDDPFLTNAIDCSIWEVALLKRHYSAMIRDRVKEFEKPVEKTIVKSFDPEDVETPTKKPKLSEREIQSIFV